MGRTTGREDPAAASRGGGAGTPLSVRLPVRAHRRGPRLVGRDPELARLDRELDRCRRGGLRCVLLSGEPGVGKTRLAEELLHRHADTCHGVAARAYPLGTAAPFSLWIDAFEPVLAVLEPADVAGLCDGFAGDLAGLLHGVAAATGSGPPGEPPRQRLLEGLARILDGLARVRPMIAVLDDVHLADPSSWDVLRHAARRFPDRPLLVVATARQAELAGNDVAARVLFELEQDDALTRIELGPLERPGVAELAEALIERPPPPELVDWLAARSRGNALFAVGLLRALLEEGADLAAPRLERLPESLTERVAGRVRGLGDADRTTLELLAVLGRPVELGELVRITGRPLEDLAATLTVLLAGRASPSPNAAGRSTSRSTIPSSATRSTRASGRPAAACCIGTWPRRCGARVAPGRRPDTSPAPPRSVTPTRSPCCARPCGRRRTGRPTGRRWSCSASWSSCCRPGIPAGSTSSTPCRGRRVGRCT